MIDRILPYLAPHYCLSCGQIGREICKNCKYDITDEPFLRCIVCEQPTVRDAKCSTCTVPFTRAWCVGERSGALKGLIDGLKFERRKSSALLLAELLAESTPHIDGTTVTYIPTIMPHVRVRGYDHMALVAKHYAKLKGVPCEPVLRRKENTTQRGAHRRLRTEQAKRAFYAPKQADGVYVLLDDVVTTGATVRYGVQTLRDAGAHDVWVAVIARQPSTHPD